MFSRIKSLLPMGVIRRRGPFAWFWRNRDLRYHKIWSREDQKRLEFYSTLVRPGEVAFDIGANIGNRTKVLAKIGAKVVAIEPQPYCLSVLRRAYREHPNVSIVPMAVGASQGELKLFQPDPGSPIASASRDWIDTVTKHGRHADAKWDHEISIPMTTMDALIAEHGKPVFVKVDVEGFEPNVLAGLSIPIPCVSVEFAPEYLDPLIEAIDRLRTFADVKANYILGEATEFVLSKWESPDRVFDALRGHAGDIEFWGDVYIRMTPLTR